MVRPFGREAASQSEVRREEEIRALEREPRGDPRGGERAVGRGHALHVGVQGGGQQIRDTHLHKHVLAEGRKTHTGSEQSKKIIS